MANSKRSNYRHKCVTCLTANTRITVPFVEAVASLWPSSSNFSAANGLSCATKQCSDLWFEASKMWIWRCKLRKHRRIQLMKGRKEKPPFLLWTSLDTRESNSLQKCRSNRSYWVACPQLCAVSEICVTVRLKCRFVGIQWTTEWLLNNLHIGESVNVDWFLKTNHNPFPVQLDAQNTEM